MESSNVDILQQKPKGFGKDSQTNVMPYQAAVSEASFCLAKAKASHEFGSAENQRGWPI